MNDKVILITGGTGGIGKQTAIGLAELSGQIIVTGRNRQRGESALREIKQASGNRKVDLLLADLSIQAEVCRLANDVKARYSKLDVLINNAGLLESKCRKTSEGVEANFAVNVIAPYLLIMSSTQVVPEPL
jgi:retinol dehydrogenase 14